ncbi:MAG: hypothetical protein K1W34_16605 [Lachnospiraceae bacterium]
MSEKITDNEDGHSSGVTGVVACFSNENDVILKREREKKKYYCPENLDGVEQNLISCMKWFQEDTQEICKLKGLDYSAYLGDIISLNRDLRER